MWPGLLQKPPGRVPIQDAHILSFAAVGFTAIKEA